MLLLTEAVRRRSAPLLILHFIAFFMALLTKETALVLLPIFPIWIHVFAEGVPSSGCRRSGVVVAVVGWALCTMLYVALRTVALKGGPAIQVPGPFDLFSRAAAYAAYVFLPVDVPVYAWFQDLPWTRAALSNAVGLLLLAVAWGRSGRDGRIPCAIAAGVLFIVPSAFSDRFLPHRLYLPVFFFVLAATEAARAARSVRIRKAIPLAVAVVALGLGGVTAHDLRRFKNPEAFWQATIEDSPSCGEAMYELGSAAQKRGDLLGAERYYRKAIAESPATLDARRQLALQSGARKTYDNLVYCLLRIGATDEAARYQRLAVTLKE